MIKDAFFNPTNILV